MPINVFTDPKQIYGKHFQPYMVLSKMERRTVGPDPVFHRAANSSTMKKLKKLLDYKN